MATSSRSSSTTSKRGFAAMDPAKQKKIAAMGGKAAHAGSSTSKSSSTKKSSSGSRSMSARKS